MSNRIELPEELILKTDWSWDSSSVFLQQSKISDAPPLKPNNRSLDRGMTKLRKEAVTDTIDIISCYCGGK